ncbi:MAG: hypothetical protein A2X64_02230 [Ignavibacteria bacterium GWF2_33_9]|nr:MAG: hypothetical protein A2X64_02230 [Ignavibacteria bacterium GWF2_33_9]
MKNLILFFLIFSFTTSALAGEVFIKINESVSKKVQKLIIESSDKVLTEMNPTFSDTILVKKKIYLYKINLSEGSYLIKTEDIQMRPISPYLIPGDTLEIGLDKNNDNNMLFVKKSNFKETDFESKVFKEFPYNQSQAKNISDFDSANHSISIQFEKMRNFLDSSFSNYRISNKFQLFFQNKLSAWEVSSKLSVLPNLIKDTNQRIQFLISLAKTLDSASNVYFDAYNNYAILLSLLSKIEALNNSNKSIFPFERLTDLADMYIKNNQLNYLAKAKILEDRILFKADSKELESIKTKFLNNNSNLDNYYYKYLLRMFEKSLINNVGGIPTNFELFDNYGKKHKLYDYKGKYIYLAFGGTWCPPCMEELEFIKKVLKGKEQFDNKIIIIFLESDIPKWKNFAKKLPDNVIYLVTPDGWDSKVLSDYLIRGVPKSYLICPEMKILNVRMGFDEKEMQEILDKYYLK